MRGKYKCEDGPWSFGRGYREVQPRKGRAADGPYAGGSHTVLRHTVPDEMASYELRTGGEAAWI